MIRAIVDTTLVTLSPAFDALYSLHAYPLGGIQMRARQCNDAEQSFRQARTMAPKNPDAVRAQAQATARLGMFDEADTLMNEAAALSSKVKDKAGPRKIAIGRAGVLHARAAHLASVAAIALY